MKDRGFHEESEDDALDAERKREPYSDLAGFDYDLCGKLGSSGSTLSRRCTAWNIC